MLRRCLMVIIFRFAALPGVGLAEPQIVQFDMVYRKDSGLGLKLFRTFETAFRQAGFGLSVEQFPVRRGVEELKNRRLDGAIGRVDNLVTHSGVTNYIRLDVPLLMITMSLWCKKDANAMKNLKNPRVAYLESSPFAARIARQIDDQSILLSSANSYHKILVMLNKGRLDCLLASQIHMDSEQVNHRDLQGLFQHDLVTLPAFSWIASKHENLKPLLEKELRKLVGDKEWRKTYFQTGTQCGANGENVCPDGRIFARQVKVLDGEIQQPFGVD